LRKWKRYRYARTQEHFRKNPNLLAKYIREGIPWLENKDSSYSKPEYAKSFYTALWGTTPDITIAFTLIGSGHKALDIGEVFQAITARDINECLDHLRQNSAAWAVRISKALGDTHDKSNPFVKCRNIHSKLVSILTDISENNQELM